MIHIKILNHSEVATTQGGLMGHIGKGLDALGLMDLSHTVEKKIAGMIEAQLRDKGVQVEVNIVPDA